MSKNQIILASAGTGKTTFIIENVKKLNLEKVIIISFTNSSCEDIRHKLKGVDVMTLHSFLFNIMKSEEKIIEDISLLVKIFIEHYPKLENINEIVNIYNKASLGNFNPDFSTLNEKELEMNKDLLNLFLDIEKEKKRLNLITFNDIIKTFNKEIYFKRIEENYDHLFLDESQDLSILQLEIIEKIIDKVFSKKNKSFTIVGDVKQSIYSFQGASVESYEKFLKNLETKYSLKIETRNKTYRFGGKILNFVNNIYPDHSSDKNDGIIKEINIKKDELIKFIKENILEPNKTMILYERQTKLIQDLQEELHHLGLKIKIFVEENIIFKNLKHICSIFFNQDTFSIISFFQGPFVFMSEPDLYNNYKELKVPNFIFEYFHDSYSLLLELSKNFYGSYIDKMFFEKLILLSKNRGNLYEFIMTLPNYIYLEKPGIQFSTVHSAKGLENDKVFFIQQKTRIKKLFISINPFFVKFESDSCQKEKKNFQYVAYTRARKEFYLLNII